MSLESHPATFSEADEKFMRRALELAARGIGQVSPNPMVGAVITRGSEIVGEGWHRALGGPHAEVEAIRAATADLRGATMYVTLEPCSHQGRTPPCAPLVAEKGIARLVATHADPNPLVAGQGFKLLKGHGVHVEVGLLEAEAKRLNEPFLTYHRLKRPHVTSKWAMTLDGRIATENGDSKWISNEQSRHFVHELRGQVDAVMVGIGTVLIDDPQLTVRLTGYQGRQPRPIIIDSSLRVPRRAKCLAEAPPGHCVIITSNAAAQDRVDRLRDDGHNVVVLPAVHGALDMAKAVTELARQFEVQSVLCEGGSSIHGALLKAKVVDKVIAFISPKIIGGQHSRGPVSGWQVALMRKALQLSDISVKAFGDDVCYVGYVPDAFRLTKPRGAARSRAKP